MSQGKLVVSAISTFLSLAVFLTAVFAWFSLSDESDVHPIAVSTGDYAALLKLEAARNDGPLIQINDGGAMATLFANAVPTEGFFFKFTVTNDSNSPVVATIILKNVQSMNVPSPFDMRDVFAIEDGTVTVDGADQTLSVNSTDPVVVEGQTLLLHRLSNLTNADDSIILAQGIQLEPDEETIISFRLIYDPATSSPSYRYGRLYIQSLQAVFN
jgi:hypothetical protein